MVIQSYSPFYNRYCIHSFFENRFLYHGPEGKDMGDVIFPENDGEKSELTESSTESDVILDDEIDTTDDNELLLPKILKTRLTAQLALHDLPAISEKYRNLRKEIEEIFQKIVDKEKNKSSTELAVIPYMYTVNIYNFLKGADYAFCQWVFDAIHTDDGKAFFEITQGILHEKFSFIKNFYRSLGTEIQEPNESDVPIGGMEHYYMEIFREIFNEAIENIQKRIPPNHFEYLKYFIKKDVLPEKLNLSYEDDVLKGFLSQFYPRKNEEGNAMKMIPQTHQLFRNFKNLGLIFLNKKNYLVT